MLLEENIPKGFCREPVSIVVYIMNREQLRVKNDKSPYELWKGRRTSIKYFKNFRSKCYVKINEDNLGKFNSRANEGIFLGYSTKSKAYKCYNKILR